MGLITVAQIEMPRPPTSSSTAPVIQAPSNAKPTSGGSITAPGFGSQQILPNVRKETEEDRERRLQEAGVLAKPTPTPEPRPKPKIVTEFNKLQESAKRPDGRVMSVQNRFQANIASWFPILKAKNTTVVPDLSYGFVYLHPFETEPLSVGIWNRQNFWGVGFASYNGGTTVAFKDSLGNDTKVYADTNVTELGGEFAQALQTATESGQVWGFELTERVYPVRIIKSRYSTIVYPPDNSEVTQRYMFNYFGVGFGGNAFYSFAQFFRVGFFTDFNFAAPFQMKMRAGLTLEMTQRAEEKKSAETTPAPTTLPASTPVPAPSTAPTPAASPVPTPTPAAGAIGSSSSAATPQSTQKKLQPSVTPQRQVK